MGSIQMVAVLITDLVGSTQLETSVGPEAAELLREEHFGLLREAIEGARGREIKTLGDGIMAAFDSAAAAVACATSLQQRLERRNRGAEYALGLRMGISAGDATFEDGDYFGLPVIEAARLSAYAAGGQILVSDVTRLLVGRRGDHTFTPVGDLELKGLPAPLPTFELTWAPLPTEIQLPDRLQVLAETTYVGRVPERDLLAQLWQRALAGKRQVALVYGEPGIGKSRLATHAALSARPDGAMVLYGHCDSDFSVSYQPWIEILTHLVRHAPGDVLETYVRQQGGDIARLVPGVADFVSDVPAPRDSEPETERYMLFTAVRALLAAVSAVVPIVLLLDDIHWADQPSLSLLRNVVGNVDPLRVLIIATYRDTDLGRGESIADVLAELRREVDVEWIGLDGLATDEVLALIEAATGHVLDSDGPALAEAVGRDTDGNPFFVVEMLRHLRESGAISESDGRYVIDLTLSAGLPKSVRDVIGQRVARLGEVTMKALSIAAVIGREFDLELLALAAGTTSDVLLDHLETAVAASVLRESPTTPGRFVFAHALINQTLYEALGRTRKARTHRRVAESLELICGDDPGDRLAELAHQWSSATEPLDLGKVIDYAHRAGARALEQLAPDEALGWFDRALDNVDRLDPPDKTLRCELLIRRGEAQKHQGDASYRETLLAAADLAGQLGDVDRMARAALLNNRGVWSSAGVVDHDRVAALERAAEALREDDPQLPRVLGLLAMEMAFVGDFEQTVHPLVKRAERLARASGDARVLTDVLCSVIAALLNHPDQLTQRVARLNELTSLADAAPDPVPRLFASWWGLSVWLECGDLAGIESSVARLQTLQVNLGQPLASVVALAAGASVALLSGDLERAEVLAAEILAEAGADIPESMVLFGVTMAAIRVEQGRVAEIIDIYMQAAIEHPELPGLQGSIAFSCAEAGRLDDARAILDAVSADRFAVIPRDFTWLPGIARVACAVCRTGTVEQAAVLYELLDPYRDRVVAAALAPIGSVHLLLGGLAAVLARYDVAEEHFVAAERVHTDLRAPFLLARTWLWWGNMLLLRGDATDRERAADLLRRASELAATHSGVATAQEADALLQTLI